MENSEMKIEIINVKSETESQSQKRNVERVFVSHLKAWFEPAMGKMCTKSKYVVVFWRIKEQERERERAKR